VRVLVSCEDQNKWRMSLTQRERQRLVLSKRCGQSERWAIHQMTQLWSLEIFGIYSLSMLSSKSLSWNKSSLIYLLYIYFFHTFISKLTFWNYWWARPSVETFWRLSTTLFLTFSLLTFLFLVIIFWLYVFSFESFYDF